MAGHRESGLAQQPVREQLVVGDGDRHGVVDGTGVLDRPHPGAVEQDLEDPVTERLIFRPEELRGLTPDPLVELGQVLSGLSPAGVAMPQVGPH